MSYRQIRRDRVLAVAVLFLEPSRHFTIQDEQAILDALNHAVAGCRWPTANTELQSFSNGKSKFAFQFQPHLRKSSFFQNGRLVRFRSGLISIDSEDETKLSSFLTHNDLNVYFVTEQVGSSRPTKQELNDFFNARDAQSMKHKNNKTKRSLSTAFVQIRRSGQKSNLN